MVLTRGGKSHIQKKKNGFTDLVSEFVIWWQKPKKVLTGAI